MKVMWQPEPGWTRLPGGMGASTAGVWRVESGGEVYAVKRLTAPAVDDPADLSRPSHFAWWRRPADVALSGVVDRTPGLRSVPTHRVDEDVDGITIWHPLVTDAENSGLFLAAALAEFAGATLPAAPWLAHGQLRDRLARVEHRGGWRLLGRTTVADVADRIWGRRQHLLGVLDKLPQVPQHGDPTPANLLGRDGAAVLAVDWSALGTGPVGADLGYLALSTREDFTPLLDGYVAALPAGLATHEQAELGAQVTAVFTAMSRAEWALTRVADRPGALAGKFRHPSVAPYLRSMQRQFPQMEALL
jgi:hypothetical protein